MKIYSTLVSRCEKELGGLVSSESVDSSLEEKISCCRMRFVKIVEYLYTSLLHSFKEKRLLSDLACFCLAYLLY